MAGKKKFELKKIIEIETVIAAILISVASWGIAKWYDFDTTVVKTRQAVFQQYSVAQNLILDSINHCLSGKKISQAYKNQRLKNREVLVQKVIANSKLIPSSAFFSISTFTRFDNAQATQDLCTLKKSEQLKLKTYIYKLEFQLWRDLKLRPS